MPTYKEMERVASFTVSRRFGGAWCVENYKYTALGATLEIAWKRFMEKCSAS